MFFLLLAEKYLDVWKNLLTTGGIVSNCST